MIRTVNTEDIVKNIKEMCIEANHYLSKDMDKALKDATVSEKSELGKKILNQLQENLKIADEEMIPICQDTGMAVIFLEVGQDVHFEGMAVEDAVNEGVRAYTSSVKCRLAPFLRFQVLSDFFLPFIFFIKQQHYSYLSHDCTPYLFWRRIAVIFSYPTALALTSSINSMYLNSGDFSICGFNNKLPPPRNTAGFVRKSDT